MKKHEPLYCPLFSNLTHVYDNPIDISLSTKLFT